MCAAKIESSFFLLMLLALMGSQHKISLLSQQPSSCQFGFSPTTVQESSYSVPMETQNPLSSFKIGAQISSSILTMPHGTQTQFLYLLCFAPFFKNAKKFVHLKSPTPVLIISIYYNRVIYKKYFLIT